MAQQARSSLLAVLLFFFSIQTVRASKSLAPATIYSSKLQQNTVNYQVGIPIEWTTIPSQLRPDAPPHTHSPLPPPTHTMSCSP